MDLGRQSFYSIASRIPPGLGLASGVLAVWGSVRSGLSHRIGLLGWIGLFGRIGLIGWIGVFGWMFFLIILLLILLLFRHLFDDLLVSGVIFLMKLRSGGLRKGFHGRF